MPTPDHGRQNLIPLPEGRGLAVICCGVLAAEVKTLLAQGSDHLTAVGFLPQRLHEQPRRLRAELQAAIDAVESNPQTQAIALVYGVCSRGVEELRHDRCPLVLARAHDCLTLFLGSKERYEAEVMRQPGTYWYTPGWIEAGAPPGPERMARLRREYAEKYDPETVEELLEMEAEGLAHYERAAYVDLGLDPGGTEAGCRHTAHCAACLGWSFERLAGDPKLLRDLLAGRWDDGRFLVVPPGHTVRLSNDDRVVRAEPWEGATREES